MIAQKVAAYLPVFAGVIASDGKVNRIGTAKGREFEARFEKSGFDYIGNSAQDLPIWLAARESHVVSPNSRLLASIRRAKVGITTIYERPRRKSPVALWLRTIRIHQWAKNLLIFVPPMLAHNPAAVFETTVAFVAFGLVASSGYVINDVLDLEADRKHCSKRRRPFASGELPISGALIAIPLLLVLAGATSVALPQAFALTLLAYFVSSLAYSLRLKHCIVVDMVSGRTLYGSDFSRWSCNRHPYLAMDISSIGLPPSLVWRR